MPDARRTESMLGRRFFIGETAGVAKEDFVEEWVDWCEERGEGVRLVDCCRAEMRADLRGEKGSQESQYPCLGVPGVRTLPGGEGVEIVTLEAIVGCVGDLVWDRVSIENSPLL